MSIETPAANEPRKISRRLLIGAGAGCLFITLSIVIGARTLSSRPVVAPVVAREAAPVRPPDSKQPVAVESAPTPTWVGRRRAVWAYDGTKTVTFALDAIADVPVWTSRARPQLVARCLSRTIEVFVVTGPLSFEPQTGSHTVRVQVDDDPERSQQWLDSDASKELFAPDGVALSDQLARAHRLRVGFTPFNAKAVTAEFIVDGFDQLAPVLARTCGRSSTPAR
jgi:hypothetical protein